MSQDEVNDQFRSMVFASRVEETEEIINQVVSCEAQARHAAACEGDREAAERFANTAYGILMSTSLNILPSVAMGVSDMFNREHEAYTLALDYIADAKEHVRQFQIFWERGDTAMALASVASVQAILDQALEGALYEKGDES